MGGGKGNGPKKWRGPRANNGPGNPSNGAPTTVPREPEVTVLVQDLFNIIRISHNKATFNPRKLRAVIDQAERLLESNKPKPDSQYVTQSQFKQIMARLDVLAPAR